MLHSLRTVTYRVPDLEKARAWYQELLGTDPVHTSPFAVVFAAGESLLTLLPDTAAAEPVAYWAVADADEAYRRMVQAGASGRTEVSTRLGRTRMGTVTDPFGNVIGVMSQPPSEEKRPLDEQPSETAQGVALLRALGAADEREDIRGGDTLAHLFIDPSLKAGLRDARTRAFILSRLPGSYEYMLARTAFFDAIVRHALEENIPQLVFLGAGYDTRAVRFRDLIRDTLIIELDTEPTQRRKRQLLSESPARYASINFQRESLAAVLSEAGYRTGVRTLFVWEGVTPYLTPDAVEAVLAFVRTQSAPGSEVAFDYAAGAPDLADRYGVKEAASAIRATVSDETIVFKVPEGTLASFLDERGFALTEHLDTEGLERRYLTLRDGTLAGRALASMRLARAIVR